MFKTSLFVQERDFFQLGLLKGKFKNLIVGICVLFGVTAAL